MSVRMKITTVKPEHGSVGIIRDHTDGPEPYFSMAIKKEPTVSKLDYEECINSLVHGYMLHKASGVPSDAIEWMLNGQVAGWLSEGLTTPSVASQVVISFNQCMRLLRPLGDVEAAIKLDTIEPI